VTFPRVRPVAYLITSGDLTSGNFETEAAGTLKIIRAAVDENIPLVQIREKQLDAKRLFQLIKDAVALTRTGKTKLFVNDRSDLAAAAGADGVHLTSNSLHVNAVKHSFPDLIVGVSAHTPDDVERARLGGADFALFGPIFGTPGKSEPLGIETLKAICLDAGTFPVIAVGGIDETNLEYVVEAGAAGFAAIRSLNDIDRLRLIARSLQ
jgi:thiamine-phosphate diphosphorylase